MKQTLILGILASINILLTMLYQWYVITQLGVGLETDALFAGMALPQLVLAVVSGSLTTVLIPLLATEDEKTFRQTAWGFFMLISGLFTFIALVLHLSASHWIPLLVPGFSGAGQALTVSVTRIQLLGMILTANISVLWSVYYAKHQFFWVEVSAIFSTLIGFIALAWLLPHYGIIGAAWTLVLIAGLRVILLLPGLGRWQRPQWKSPTMIEARRRIQPLLIGTVYYKTDPLVDRFLASMAPAGTISLLYLAQQLYSVATQVLGKAIANPMIPLLSTQTKIGNWTLFRQIYRQRLFWMAGLTGLTYLTLLLFGQTLLSILIGYGDITAENVHLLWLILLALFGTLIGGAMGQITSSAFYASGDTKTPTQLGILTYTIYIPLKIIAFHWYGLMGLTLSISLFTMVNFGLQLMCLKKVQTMLQRSAA